MASIAARPATGIVDSCERLLQVNVYLLATLGTLLLGMAQQFWWHAIAVAVLGIVAFWITDRTGRFCLTENSAGVLAVTLMVIVFVRLASYAGQSQLLNVANGLAYLEMVLFFQRKQSRVYWSLMAMSLLQVVVAAALNLDVSFGILSGLFVVLATSALTLLFVVVETAPFAQRRRDAANGRSTGGSHAAGGQSQTDSPTARRTSFVPTLWPNPAGAMLTRSFLKKQIAMVVMTAAITTLVFFLLPRFERQRVEDDTQQVTTSGFTEEVRLDDIGRILESAEQVMRAEFRRLDGSPYQVDGEPYFRGTVLSEYRGRGVWRQFRGDRATRPLQQRQSFDLSTAVLQTITLQPGSHSVLFHCAPCYPVTETPPRLSINVHTHQLVLRDEERHRGGTYRYTLATSAFRNGLQKDLLPALRYIGDVDGDPTGAMHTREWWMREYPGLTQTAERALADEGLVNGSLFARAKALEAHLKNSGLYRYSLEPNQNRTRQLDPIEDFVRNHRQGHCEYFAAALTLMLRSQQIPARMVVGYKGGEYNSVGSFYLVRQLHAHAWAEAYLSPQEIPPDDQLSPLEDQGRGAWLRLDPTPGDTDVEAANERLALIKTMREIADYCQVLWDDYVLGLNRTRQQQAIYQPLRRAGWTAVHWLLGREAWNRRLGSVRSLGQRLASGDPVTWTALLASCLLLALLWRFRRMVTSSFSAVARRVRRPIALRRGKRARVAIYEELERALARHGLRRPPTQTPQEFALAVGGRLAEDPAAVHVAGVPRRIVAAYYRIRFGDAPLPPEESAALHRSLAQLRAALARR